jgi:hypothetical protein
MESLRTVQALQCAVMVSLGLGISQAYGADDCSGGTAALDKSHEERDLANGNVMSSFIGYDVIGSDEDSSSNADMTNCHSTWLVSFDGKSKGGGYCAFKDKDGDTEYVEWEATPHGGTWRDMGGTGKWASKHNSGWTKEVAREGQMALIQWGGTCERWDVCRARTNAGISALRAMARLPSELFDTKLSQARR